ncbi:MAG: hypothetical protein AAF602_00575 [Myxococcota bacterium]
MGRIAEGLIIIAALTGCQGDSPDPGDPASPAFTPPPEVELGTELTPLDLEPAANAVTGGHLAMLDDGRTVAVADPHGDRLLLLDWQRGDLVRQVDLPAHSHAGRVLQGIDGTLWVVLRRGDRVVGVLPDADGTLVEVGTCVEPRGLAADADGSMWVACGSGLLVQFDVEGVQTQIPVGPDLRDVVVDPRTGALWVSQFRSAAVFAVARDGRTERVTLPGFVDDFDGFLVDSTFHAALAWRMLAHPDGGLLVVHQRGRTSPVDIRDPSEEDGIPPYYKPLDVFPDPLTDNEPEGSCSGILHGALTRIDEDRGITSTAPIRAAALPVDAAVGPQGRIYVAAAAAAPDTEADRSLLQVGEEAFATMGSCYDAPEVLPAGDAVVTSVAVAPSGEVLALGEQPLTLFVDGEPRLVDSVAGDAGAFRLFHRNASFGVSCAGCHPEGHEDGHTWTFRASSGDLVRRTQTLGGRLLSTGPFHWDGEFDTLLDLMDEVWGRRMGGGNLPESEVDDLGTYLDELPPVRSSPRSPPLVSKGAEAFERAACAGCHPAPVYTDNHAYDVGTGGTFQVPSLVGVASRLPLMHDGCAETLRERFDPDCGGDRHGSTEALTQDDIEALQAFLETL